MRYDRRVIGGRHKGGKGEQMSRGKQSRISKEQANGEQGVSKSKQWRAVNSKVNFCNFFKIICFRLPIVVLLVANCNRRVSHQIGATLLNP